MYISRLLITSNTENKPRFFFYRKRLPLFPEHLIIGVYDDHGIKGHLISDFISNTLSLNINSPSLSSITSGFLKTNNDLITISKIVFNLSVTTYISLLITLKSITCANSGDSRAVLQNLKMVIIHQGIWLEIKNQMKKMKWKEFYNIMVEYHNILMRKVEVLLDLKEFGWKNIPDLAMTRIFGDLIVHNVGVIAEPEIGIYDFGGCEKFVIVASNGVWDFNDSEESVHYVKKFYENGMGACGVVIVFIKEAYRRWRRDNDKKEYEKFEEYLIKEDNKNEFEENEKHNFEFNEEDEEKESEVKVQIKKKLII